MVWAEMAPSPNEADPVRIHPQSVPRYRSSAPLHSSFHRRRRLRTAYRAVLAPSQLGVVQDGVRRPGEFGQYRMSSPRMSADECLARAIGMNPSAITSSRPSPSFKASRAETMPNGPARARQSNAHVRVEIVCVAVKDIQDAAPTCLFNRPVCLSRTPRASEFGFAPSRMARSQTAAGSRASRLSHPLSL